MKAPLPSSEAGRLDRLRRYEILDTSPERDFDDITLLASHICGTPIAMISLIDENRQWFKSKIGITESETSREIAFCAHGILQPDVFVIEDAMADERFASNPLVTGKPGIRFYAGSPLITPDGHALGMLSVEDRVPRELDADQKAGLKALSRQVVAQLELRRTISQLKQTEGSLLEHSRLAALQGDVGSALIQGGPLMRMLQLCSEAIVKHLGAAFARIWTLNQEQTVLELQASAGLYTHLDGPHSRVPVGKFKIGLIAKERKPQLTNQLIGDPCVGDQDWAKREGMVAFAGYPLIVEDRVLGVVAMFAQHELAQITLSALAAIANNIALGIEGKRAEQALRESGEKFQQLADNIADAFWIRSPDMSEVHYISPAFERIWGRSMQSLYANPERWADFIFAEDRERVLGAFAALTAGASSLDIEYRIVRPEGEIRWIRVRAWHVRDALDKLIRHTGIVTDITERKRVAEELRESERRFSDMLRNLELVSVMLDRDMRITWCNDHLLRLTDWRREDVIGRDWFELFIPPEIFSEVRRVHAALLDDQPAAWHYENEILIRSGTRRLIRWNNSVLRSASGDVIGTASIGEDITERRQAEAALQSSEARTKAIVQSSLDCIIVINHEGNVLEFNPAAEKVFGLKRCDVLGRELAEVIIPQSLREGHRQGLAHYLATGEAHVIGKRVEMTALRSDGSHFPVELAITRMGTETPPTFTGFIRDITERKHAEAARDRLVAILESTTDLVSISDPEGNLLYLNRSGRDLMGVGPHEDISRTDIAQFLPNPATHPILTEGIPTAVRLGIWSGETILLSRHGLEVPISQVILAHKSPDGELEFLSTIVRDITERKRLEAQLFQSQKMETVGKLAGGVAHEFNSILTAIIGQSELLLQDLPSGSPLTESATEINRAASRAATLTRQLLAYGRKQILQPEILDLNAVLSSMEGVIRHLMGGHSEIRIVPAANLKTVKADPGQIEQVIMNMVMNAADAMPLGGKLTLETGNITWDDEYVGRFPELKPGDYIMLSITDTGRGMSEEVKARIFEPFFTTKSVGQGMGLGLSTCYGIIKQSGGHMATYSEPGRGATFKIYLPQAEPLTNVSPQLPGSTSLPRGTETILLVENDPALREMASTLLTRLGYTVLTAGNGEEALTLAQQEGTGHIDLLFTDLVMPHMTGKELGERVRELFPETKILFTSAYTEAAVLHQGALNPGMELLQKPFTPSALARKIREILNIEKGLEGAFPEGPVIISS
jgi:two-component system cell cycle sensor histidine kinase/response regulator CckA